MPTFRSIISAYCGIVFKLGVRVEAGGFSYTGRGRAKNNNNNNYLLIINYLRSKKEAKIAAAVAALSSLYPQYTCGEVKMF